MFPDSSIGNIKAHFGGLFFIPMFLANFDSMDIIVKDITING